MTLKRNWIICPFRNGLAMTRAAVESFLRQDIGDVSVLLIDNSGSDEVWEGIWRLDPKNVWRIQNTTPKGVAASWNQGINHAFTLLRRGLILPPADLGQDAVLVVNNDAEIMPWTYRLLLEDGGSFVTARGVVHRTQMLDARPVPESKWSHPDFGCYLIRRSCWKRVGPFDEQFGGAYAEDNDFHVRMHIAGIEAVSVNVPYWHKVSGTLKHCTPQEQAEIQRQADRNRERFEFKWGFRIPPHDDGKYTEFFSQLRGYWVPFAENRWEDWLVEAR